MEYSVHKRRVCTVDRMCSQRHNDACPFSVRVVRLCAIRRLQLDIVCIKATCGCRPWRKVVAKVLRTTPCYVLLLVHKWPLERQDRKAAAAMAIERAVLLTLASSNQIFLFPLDRSTPVWSLQQPVDVYITL